MAAPLLGNLRLDSFDRQIIGVRAKYRIEHAAIEARSRSVDKRCYRIARRYLTHLRFPLRISAQPRKEFIRHRGRRINNLRKLAGYGILKNSVTEGVSTDESRRIPELHGLLHERNRLIGSREKKKGSDILPLKFCNYGLEIRLVTGDECYIEIALEHLL